MEVRILRNAEVKRNTTETDIALRINIDGTGNYDIKTGVGFFDHMLEQFSKHGLMDLQVSASGDLEVDAHHTVEDVGIVLGQAIRKAVGEGVSIKRYGSCIVPMDEALVLAVVDAGGRPHLEYDADVDQPALGGMDAGLVREFLRAVAWNAGMNIHIRKLSGSDGHHIAEAVFKSFGRAVDEALTIDSRIKGVMSTKGKL